MILWLLTYSGKKAKKAHGCVKQEDNLSLTALLNSQEQLHILWPTDL